MSINLRNHLRQEQIGIEFSGQGTLDDPVHPCYIVDIVKDGEVYDEAKNWIKKRLLSIPQDLHKFRLVLSSL